jgi:hypothetical protein
LDISVFEYSDVSPFAIHHSNTRRKTVFGVSSMINSADVDRISETIEVSINIFMVSYDRNDMPES